MTTRAYITALGAFLPGEPVPNDAMEALLGLVFGKPSRARTRVLSNNKIETRHYALDAQGKATSSIHAMAAAACRQALDRAVGSEAAARKVQYLAAASSLDDLFLPGLASMVHGELKCEPCEIASFSGVCCSGMAALSAAAAQLKSGLKTNALVTASEFPSRHFRAEKFESQDSVKAGGGPDMDAEFLRWMLSDGAGAAYLSSQPASRGLSLEIEWLDMRSYADRFEACMYAGAEKGSDGKFSGLWGDYQSYEAAVAGGAFSLRQDFKILDNIVKIGVQRYLELLSSGRIDPNEFDYFACHYSSHHFKGQIVELLEKAEAAIPESKWFSNLSSKGNTGSASIFIMLEELMYSGRLKAGQKVLCMVPESGRFTVSFMMLKVVEAALSAASAAAPPATPAKADPTLKAELLRQLGATWLDFEARLGSVPFVKRISDGTLALADYQDYLLNVRQQVVEGSRWITRAASNLSGEGLDVRSLFIMHAKDEHLDYKLLEENYASTGGDRAVIRAGRKNLGSEALSAFMFQRASEPNPFDLLGSMFIIEGLGSRMASHYGRQIRDQLKLQDAQVSFILYHGDNDPEHIKRLDQAIDMMPLTPELLERTVKTARVTARLYLLQLEEIGNF